MTRKTSVALLAAMVLLSGVAVQAATVVFREAGGTGYVDMTFDQTDINVTNNNVGNATNYYTNASDPNYTLLGFKDLPTALPITSSDIVSATFTVKSYQGDNDTVTLARVLTDWLVNAAGSNQSNVTGEKRDLAGNLDWAAGAFSTSDYDAANAVTKVWPASVYNVAEDYDVTDLVKDMYDTGQFYGFVMYAASGTGVLTYSNSNGDVSRHPYLTIVYNGLGHTLTVNSGSGSGTYELNDVVPIVADAPASGMAFDQWIGDTAYLADPLSASTDVTMPEGDVEVTATYAAGYILTVNSGTGSGTYIETTVVNIVAEPPASGDVFVEWIGDAAALDDPAAATAAVTMPASDVEVTATYAAAALYTLTVNSGTGSGDYQENWVVDIVADPAPTGTVFAQWTGDVAGVADVNAGTTTYTMPAAAAEITATYDQLYTLTVNSGSGGGDYLSGTAVGITADPAPAGQKFHKWIGDTAVVDNAYTASTTVTMPSSNVEVTATYNSSGTLIVDFGNGGDVPDVMTFEDWTTQIYGLYTQYSDADPDGLVAGWNGHGLVGGVTGSTAHTFSVGNIIVATWYNTGGGSLTIDPEISLDDPDNYGGGNGTWYAMTQVTIPAGQSATSTFTIDAATAGDYYLVSVCRETNAANNALLDKIELIEAVPAYTLTVNSGTGGGDYPEATVVDIVADAAPSGEIFEQWIGDTDYVADVSAASTTVQMPDQAVEVTATYRTIEQYDLTVNSGTGSGTYDEASEVPISADSPVSGDVFDQWTGDVAGVADVFAADTTITMPRADAEVTATYRAAVSYTLVVNSGTGSGFYPEQSVVPISADPAPSGDVFDRWTGDTGGVADIFAANTTITMPSGNAEITATYKLANYIAFRDGDTSLIDTAWDDIEIYLDSAGTNNSAYGLPVTPTRPCLMAIKDMFTYLPVVDNNEVIQVSSATLRLVQYGAGDIGNTFDFYRIKTPWLFDAAGSNETDVNGLYAEVSSSTQWAQASNFTLAKDTDPASKATDSMTDAGYNAVNIFDITSVIQAIYTSGRNEGFCISSVNDSMGFRSAQYNEGLSRRPLLEIMYQRVPATFYTLTVNSGTGSGSYAAGMEAELVADTPPAGQLFDQWTGDTAGIDYVNSANAILTMPAANAEVTATYITAYTLTVNSGSGSGTYTTGEVVDISADAPPAGQAFAAWTGDTGGIADVNASTTTLTMPAGDTEVTATYTALPTYNLTVNSGSGSGQYWQDQVVDISADAPPTGQIFAAWVGDTANLADAQAADTTVTMPAADVEVTATYAAAYVLTVNSGSGSGTYAVGVVVDVTADTAPTDMVFAEWVGDTADVADPSAAATTVTMPANDVEITATYTAGYTLTVNSGSGDGDYAAGAVVSIAGDPPAEDFLFDQWIGDTAYLDDPSSRITTVTMPAGDIEVTATYQADLPVGTRIKFREGGGGEGYVDTTMDDTYISLNPADDMTHGDETTFSVVNGATTGGGTPNDVSLFAVKDLFTLLPASSGGADLTINNARLIVYRYLGPKGTPFEIARVTTNWLTDVAGTNENDVSGMWSDNTDFMLWADYIMFGSQDYDAATVSAEIQDGGYNARQMYDVTSLIQAMYAAGTNYGLALIGQPGYDPGEEYYGISFRSSEYTVSEPNYHPVLQIDYQYGPVLYTLTVNSGAGSGSYAAGTVVNIDADAAPSGQVFDAWTGDVSGVADTAAASTTITMPAADATVTATYKAASTLAGDLSGDGFVGQDDLDIVLDQWGHGNPPNAPITDPRADASGDGFVGQDDLDIVLDDWGKSAP